MKTICFANNKGGSGKSTTCSNVGYFLAESGKKVLLISRSFPKRRRWRSRRAKTCTPPSKKRRICAAASALPLTKTSISFPRPH